MNVELNKLILGYLNGKYPEQTRQLSKLMNINKSDYMYSLSNVYDFYKQTDKLMSQIKTDSTQSKSIINTTKDSSLKKSKQPSKDEQPPAKVHRKKQDTDSTIIEPTSEESSVSILRSKHLKPQRQEFNKTVNNDDNISTPSINSRSINDFVQQPPKFVTPKSPKINVSNKKSTPIPLKSSIADESSSESSSVSDCVPTKSAKTPEVTKPNEDSTSSDSSSDLQPSNKNGKHNKDVKSSASKTVNKIQNVTQSLNVVDDSSSESSSDSDSVPVNSANESKTIEKTKPKEDSTSSDSSSDKVPTSNKFGKSSVLKNVKNNSTETKNLVEQSSSESSSESDSAPMKPGNTLKVPQVPKPTEDSTSSDSSSDGASNNNEESNKSVMSSVSKNVKKIKTMSELMEIEGSSSDSSSDSNSDPVKSGNTSKTTEVTKSSMESTSSDSSSDDAFNKSEQIKAEKAPLSKTSKKVNKLSEFTDKTTKKFNTPTSESIKRPAKKELKHSASKKPTKEAIIPVKLGESSLSDKVNKKTEKSLKKDKVDNSVDVVEKSRKSPVKRLDDVVIPDNLRNNSFEAKSGARGSWGEKANDKLKKVKGKDFKREKTKNKKGRYSGGVIDTSVHSIKFDD